MVEWRDLLGKPWTLDPKDDDGMDCATVAEVIYERLGLTPPSMGRWRGGGTQARIEAFFFANESRFERIGEEAKSATELGDLIVSDPEARPGDPLSGRHLAVVVETGQGMALTAHKRMGVVAQKLWAMQNVLGVYRLK